MTTGIAILIPQQKGIKTFNGAIACILLELFIYFMKNNMKKNLKVDLFCKCLNVTHRLLCYQKKNRIRLNFTWKEFCNTLFLLMHEISHEEIWQKPDIEYLTLKIATLFNFYITYGDTFLASTEDYDNLYYELIRLQPVVKAFYLQADQHNL